MLSAPSISFNLDEFRKMKQLEQQAGMYGHSSQLPPGTYPPDSRAPYPPGFNSPHAGLLYAESSHEGDFQSSGSMYAQSAAQVSGRKKRSVAAATAAGDGAAGLVAPPAKKSRARGKKKAVAEAATAPSSTDVPARAPAAPPMVQSQYPPPPGSELEPDLDALSQRTREISAAARKPREPQVRMPWLPHDVKLLIKAIDTYQCKWSTIEKQIKDGTIPFKRARDQQALRDKARLLKQDLLK